MDHAAIEAFAQAFADAPRLAEMEIRSPGQGTLRLRRSLVAAEKKSRPAPKSVTPPPPMGMPGTSDGVDEAVAATTVSPTGTVVASTLVGVFRVTPKTQVGVGSVVASGQTLGAVEVMRLSSDVAAPVAGIVTAIFVQDGQPVEYGQPLFEIAEVNSDDAQDTEYA